MTTRSGGEVEARIDSLIGEMTLEEKILLCHAGSKFAVAGIPRLGIPKFWMSDGPHGVRREISADSWDPVDTEDDYSTYLPTGTAMAATWNIDAARIFGETLGAESRARGKDVILGPGINIIRSPLCGRNFEYYSEDPYLIAALVVPVIQGIQSQDVAACVKHFAANSQELNRHGVDAQMDERTLREIYLPGFKAAIVEGGCLTAMGAYNKFRGQFCCHNQYLVNDILKGEWKFEGSYISDWAGVEDTMEAACNGLDIEMGTNPPYDEYFLARPFREAIQRGELSEDLENDKVRRNLRVMFRIGMFDADRKPGERNTVKHQKVTLDIAREAMVLLKNENELLPLKKSELRRIAVIGDNAMTRHAFGGNSSAVKALYEVTPLEGVKKKTGGEVEVRYFRGYPRKISAFESIKVEYLGTADEGSGTKGWKGTYFSNRDGQGAPVVRADGDVDFEWNGSGPFEGWPAEKFSVTWKTTLTPPESGTYEFILEGANHASFVMDGHDFLQRWENGGENVISKPMELEGGRVYQLGVVLKPGGPDVRIRIGWIPPWMERKTEEPGELLEAVRNADAVLFFGGLNHQFDVEGFDRRDMTLPDGQDGLLEQVVAANPRTVVILTGGSPMEMPWKDRVSAIVLMWYAGMEGGNAIADVLFGDVNPAGKLPMTFPKALQDSPATALDDYAADVCHYKEGVFTGYRWFDAKGIEPLFPFGHGLSYTTFKLSGMKVAKMGGEVSVALDVTNTGKRAGAEVVQIYVSPRKPSVERPVRELKGFAKVMLQPGETKSVEVLLPGEAFAFWCMKTNGWRIEEGEFVIEAGTSSRMIVCVETYSWRDTSE